MESMGLTVTFFDEINFFFSDFFSFPISFFVLTPSSVPTFSSSETCVNKSFLPKRDFHSSLFLSVIFAAFLVSTPITSISRASPSCLIIPGRASYGDSKRSAIRMIAASIRALFWKPGGSLAWEPLRIEIIFLSLMYGF